MITLHVALEVRDSSDIATISELLAEHTRRSRAEPGCARFELLQSRDKPTSFFIVEDWESAEALDVHRTATSFTTIFEPRIVPLVEARVDVVGPVG